MELEDVAEELYALPPEEFIAARRDREAAAREDGDRALAKEIAGLGKPSTAAWVCNLLAREQRGEIEGLVELGGMLREAQENLAGEELRALDVQRRRLIAALARQGRTLAYAHGHTITTQVAVQVEETLRAALADPDAGEAVLAGRLTTSLNYSGLGTGGRPDLKIVPPPRERTREKPAPAPKRTTGRDGDADARRRARERAEAERQAAEERRRRELAEVRRAVDEAVTAAEEADATRTAEESRAARLRAREEELRARVDELAEELARVRDECTRAGTELARAERRQKSAVRTAEDAGAALERARARLAELETPEPR